MVPEAGGLTPTLAMKFPRTKIPSANILANTSFEPSKSYNFFENDFKTRVKFFTSVKARRLSKRNSLRKRKQFSRSVSLTLVVSTLTVILSQTSCFLSTSHSPLHQRYEVCSLLSTRVFPGTTNFRLFRQVQFCSRHGRAAILTTL